MREGFIRYLESIGITEALRKRIETIYGFYREICPDEIKDIFVTDYINGDGSRKYENLWFFSEKCGMEATQFTIKDSFDIVPVLKRVWHWRIEKQDYDFKKATEKSRLYLSFDIGSYAFGGELKASKENCDHLRDIILKYVVPNLKE